MRGNTHLGWMPLVRYHSCRISPSRSQIGSRSPLFIKNDLLNSIYRTLSMYIYMVESRVWFCSRRFFPSLDLTYRVHDFGRFLQFLCSTKRHSYKYYWKSNYFADFLICLHENSRNDFLHFLPKFWTGNREDQVRGPQFHKEFWFLTW